MEFFAYKLGCKPGRILFDSEEKKQNLRSRLVSLSCSSHEKVRAAKKTQAGMLCRLTSLNHHMCELARRGAQLLQVLLR